MQDGYLFISANGEAFMKAWQQDVVSRGTNA
jgi:hypothetical protein